MKAVRLIESSTSTPTTKYPHSNHWRKRRSGQSKGRRNLPYRRTLQSRQIPSASIAKNTWP